MGFSQIPMPKRGIEAFMNGIGTARQFMDMLSQQRQREYNIHHQQTILPHLLQQYEEQHELHPLNKQHLQAQTQQAQATAGLHGAQAQQARIANIQDQIIADKMRRSQLAAQNKNANTSPGQMPPNNADPPMAEEEEEMQGQPQMQQPGQMQAPPMQQQPMGGMQEPPQQQGQPAFNPQQLKHGQIHVMNPGNPNDYYLDEMARSGMKSSSGRINPTIDRQVIDGIEYTRFPSGKETIKKVGPSDVEKQELKEALAEKRKLNEITQKDASEIKKQTHALSKPYRTLLEMRKILEKNPDLTGWGPALSVKLKRNKNKDLARLDYLAGNVQTEFAKAFGARAGAQIAKLYERIKPNIANQGEANIAMVDQGLELIDDYIKDNQSEYKDATKQELKFEPHTDRKKVQIKDESGKIVGRVNAHQVRDFLNKHPEFSRVD